MSPASELNTGNIALAETTSEAYSAREISRAIFARGGVARHVALSCHNWKRNDFRYSGAYFIY